MARVKEERLDSENIESPYTKYAFEGYLMVEVKWIEDPQQPLQVGAGLLPDWLRHKKGTFALDNYDDQLCIFRCIAVH